MKIRAFQECKRVGQVEETALRRAREKPSVPVISNPFSQRHCCAFGPESHSGVTRAALAPLVRALSILRKEDMGTSRG
jgi:hypothetical protein